MNCKNQMSPDPLYNKIRCFNNSSHKWGLDNYCKRCGKFGVTYMQEQYEVRKQIIEKNRRMKFVPTSEFRFPKKGDYVQEGTEFKLIEQDNFPYPRLIFKKIETKPVEESFEDLKRKSAQFLGRLGGLKGGKARAEKLSHERRKEIALKAARARWDKKIHKKVENLS